MSRMLGGPAPRLLVTGACGFVGANICRHFETLGWNVTGLVGPSGRNWRLPARVDISTYQVDLLDADNLMTLVGSLQPNLIVNCAAFGGYSSQKDVERIYLVNVVGLRHLMQAARHLGELTALIQLGSSSEYGTNCQAPAEDAPCWPDSDYAVSKVAATALCRYFASKHEMPAFVLRLYSVYGPYEDMSRLMPQLMLKVGEGRWPPLVNPNISRDFIYTEDVCQAIHLIYKRAASLQKGDIFNLGSGVCCTLGDLVACAQEVFEVTQNPPWGTMPARHWDHAKWYGNPAHAHKTLGWRPHVHLRDGLRRTMAWMHKDPEAVEAGLKNTVLGAL